MDRNQLRIILIVVCVLLLLVCASFFLFTDAWIEGGAKSAFFCIIGTLGIAVGCSFSRYMRMLMFFIALIGVAYIFKILGLISSHPTALVISIIVAGVAVLVVFNVLPVLTSEGQWVETAELYDRDVAKINSRRVVKQKYHQDVAREVQRTCNRCGKVWYSSIEREKFVAGNAVYGALNIFLNFFNNIAFAQWNQNAESNLSEIHRMRSCPACGSVNYDEQIV